VPPKSASSTRIPRATFTSIVLERIRNNILDGTLEPGAQLNEVELAELFGVSRGPVREALQRLIQEGLLRSEPHRGVFVPVMSLDDIVDVYFAREALESAAINRIVSSPRLTSIAKDLDKMVHAMSKAAAAGDWDELSTRDLEFHSAIVAGTESPRLERMFSTVIIETRLCLRMVTGSDAGRDSLVEEHRQISEFLRVGDSAKAIQYLRTHFETGLATLRARTEATSDG
jgi:DNA-binding GntR family transcriptional regulator